MRVVAGKWRGRVLKSPRGDVVRPTTDRVKEAMFSILGPDIVDAVFIDLCCGAGGLAVEALSRGAFKVILVDNSRKALDLARANLELCRAKKGSFELVRSDAVSWMVNWKPPAAPWFLAADPPYRSELPGAILEQMTRLARSADFRVGIIEHGSREDLVSEDAPEVPLTLDTRRYGKSTLTLIRPS